jgi:poly(hydroxyalkanoate) depolymerase family esterase
VVLHGCAQSADDIARLTRMDSVAQRDGFAVLYPEQPATANALRCWNWFLASNQGRGSGEAALLADMTQSIVRQYRLDADRVYLVGISAGGAMAGILGVTYPERFAGLGLHSPVAYGAARSLQEGTTVMKNAPADAEALVRLASEQMGERKRSLPVIVLHGGSDQLLDPKNGRVAAAQWAGLNNTATSSEEVRSAAGRNARVTTFTGSSGAQVQLWMVEGLGHAWSGGPASERFSDPAGPNATEIFVKFLTRGGRS